MMIIGITGWTRIARFTRAEFLRIRSLEFVQAAESLGYSATRTIFKHALPNSLAPVFVSIAFGIASAILIESGLSFLGIGTQPPMPSWGGMIKDHYAYLIVDKAYLAIIPGMAIMFLVLAFMFIGNALRDVLDIRST